MMMILSGLTRRTITTQSAFRSFSAFSGHVLNIENALKKAHEGETFTELSKHGSVAVLQGIGPVHSEALDQLGLKSIQKLASYKYYHMAKAITNLAGSESDFRPEESMMNINKGLDKEFETRSLQEIVEAPVSALQGISDKKEGLLRNVGVNTVGDLAEFKYCKWAESIVELSKYEEVE